MSRKNLENIFSNINYFILGNRGNLNYISIRQEQWGEFPFYVIKES